MVQHYHPQALGHRKVLQALNKIFVERYASEKLIGIKPEEFKRYVLDKIGQYKPDVENISPKDVSEQRGMTTQFMWGHNHWFSDGFSVAGRMGDRHVRVLAHLIVGNSLSIEYFQDKTVFDIGCWTGGTTLMLSAIAKRVDACEEVVKYAEMANFLCEHFLGKQPVYPHSLYELQKYLVPDNPQESHYGKINPYDVVFCPGVIYHITDIILALRIMYKMCKVGGIVLLESAYHPTEFTDDTPVLKFAGCRNDARHDANKNRGGWMWFLPSWGALEKMLYEVGFENVRTYIHYGRIFAYGEKNREMGMCKSGLSVITPNLWSKGER